MIERFRNGQIRVVQLYILADERNLDVFIPRFDTLEHFEPFCHIAGLVFNAKLTAHNIGKIIPFKHQRCLVEHWQRDILDNAVRLYVAEQRNLLKNALVNRLIAAQHDDIRIDAERAQLLDAVLRGLRLMLAGALDVRDKRYMHKNAVGRANLQGHLADCLQKRLAFYIADRTANLCNDDVRVRLFADAVDKVLDFVRNMRDDLDGLPKILSPSLLVKDV